MCRVSACVALATLGIAASVPAQNDGSVFRNPGATLDSYAVAVLPIEVLIDDARGAVLADELHQDIRRQLETIEGIHVIDSSRVQPFADSGLPSEDIARQLGVGYVVDGSIQARFRRHFVNLRLISLESGNHSAGSSAFHLNETNPASHWHPHNVFADAIERFVDGVRLSVFPEARPDAELQVAKARADFLDTGLSDKERLEALRTLKHPRTRTGYPPPPGSGGPDALRGTVAIAAAQLATESQDPHVRSSIWAVTAGVGDAYLVQPLLHALATDSDAKVRVQAARTLEDFIDQPEVREALAFARDHDQDGKVQEAARYSMYSVEEEKAALRAKVMDASLSDRERWIALFQYRGKRLHGLPFDAELKAALLKLAQTGGDPLARTHVWWHLGGSGDRDLTPHLLIAMQEDPHENVRETLVQLLSEYIDEPGVREALDDTLENDDSLLVKSAVRQVLQSADR